MKDMIVAAPPINKVCGPDFMGDLFTTFPLIIPIAKKEKPATTAKVVTEPSISPYTQSSIDQINSYSYDPNMLPIIQYYMKQV
jgi:hypothetical protein